MSAPFLLNWDDISLLLGQVEVHDSMKQAFIEYSKGNAEIPPVDFAHLLELTKMRSIRF